MAPSPESSIRLKLKKSDQWIPAPIRPYLYGFLALAAVTALTYVFVHTDHTGVSRTNLARAGAVLVTLYLLVLMWSAWLGYGPGMLMCTLAMFVVPHIISTTPPRNPPDPYRFGLLLLISLLISRGSQTRRRREAELEERVRQRTDEAVRSAEEARAAADNLREKAQLLDLAHDAILSLDSAGVLTFWNRGAEEMYGWTRAEALGKKAVDLLQTKFSEPRSEIDDRIAERGHWEGQLTHTRRDGTQIKVASSWAARRGADGQAVGYLEINTDITERQRIEEQLRHTQKLESLGVLAGGVAHDFNNLLTGILGNASLALDSLPPHHPNRRMLEEVMKAAERAADLTRQLLAYAGKGRFVMRTVDLSALVREISGLVQTSVPKTVQLRLQLADNLPGIDADPGQLQQIIMNLVINGAEAIGPDGGSVLVRTAIQPVDQHYIQTMSSVSDLLKPGQYVCLEVHDTGAGMDEETLSRIFDPFFTTKFAGRGLGLSAVLGIVRGHRGALKVYSQPGQGTTFKVLLPASQNVVSDQAPSISGDLTGSGTILVVDDESIVRHTAKHALERYGYHTVLAEDGGNAIDLYRQKPDGFAMVLLDLTMPVMSGEEALRQLQRMNPAVRVLLSSGYNEVEAVQRFAGKGLAGFIQKPYTAAALAEKVKEVLHA